jgi:hypothetical protein
MAQTPGKVFRLGTEGAAAVQRDFAATGAAGAAMGKKITEGAKSVPPALRALDSAAGQAKGAVEGLAGSAGGLGKVLVSMGPLGLAAAAGVGAAAAAFAGLQGTARAAADELKLLSGSALQANVSVEFLQELRAAASALGRDVAVVEPALKTFAVRLGEISGGIGQASLQVLATVGISEAQVQSFRNAEDGLLQLSDALSKVDDATAFNVADKLGLVDLIPILRNGSDQFEKMAAQARAAGLIIEEEVVKRAAQTAVEWDTSRKIIDVQLKQAALNAAPAFLALAKAAAEIATSLTLALSRFSDIERKSLPGLRSEIQELDRERRALLLRFGPGIAGGNADAPGAEVPGEGLLGARVTAISARNRLARVERELAQRRRREFELTTPTVELGTGGGQFRSPATSPAGAGRSGPSEAEVALANERTALTQYVESLRDAEAAAAAFAAQKALMAGATDAEVQATLKLNAELAKLQRARELGVIASDEELKQRQEALRAEAAEAQSFARREAAFARVADLVRATVAPSELYAQAVRDLDAALAENAITLDQYAQGLARAREQLAQTTGETTGLIQKLLEEDADALIGGLANSLEDAIRSGKKLDRDGIRALLAQFWRDVIFDVFVADSLSDLQKLATSTLKGFIRKVIGGAQSGEKAGSLLGSLVGSLFGAFGGGGAKTGGPKVGVPKRAAGGMAGGLTWVGEAGAELVSLPFGSYVNDAATSQAMVARMNANVGAGAPRSVTFAPVINAPGATQADIEAAITTAQQRFVAEVIRPLDASIEPRSVGAFREARRRGYLK